jgi:hypothetical protein
VSVPTPLLVGPQVEDVVEVHIRQERRYGRPRSVPMSLFVFFPSSRTPAASHFRSRRRILLCAIRCSRSRMIHPWFTASKKPRMSTWSTQFTFFLTSPLVSASNASSRLRPGQKP